MVSINKQGVLTGEPIEPFITLPDGSSWRLMMFHYIDKGTHLFTQANAQYSNEWGLFSRLKYIDDVKYNNTYEYYVLQDGVPYRWTQTSAPTAASITGFTAVTGYTKPTYGLAKANQSNTYLGYGSWWGACGCWTQYSSGGKTGIPGFTGVAEYYIALYARIDKINAFFEEDAVNANSFYEY